MIFNHDDRKLTNQYKKIVKKLSSFLRRSYGTKILNTLDPKNKVLVWLVIFIYFANNKQKNITDIIGLLSVQKTFDFYHDSFTKKPSKNSYKTSFDKPSFLSDDQYQQVLNLLAISPKIAKALQTLCSDCTNKVDYEQLLQTIIFVLICNYHQPKFASKISKNLRNKNYELQVQETMKFCKYCEQIFCLIRNACLKNCNEIIKLTKRLFNRLY